MMGAQSDETFMRLAIQKAKEGIEEGQTPFGACIVKDGEVVSCEHNNVWNNTDITAHAEICAIREACKKLNTIDLSSCIIYSTTEPCPMCYSAIHWAKISKIVFGARIGDAKFFGFSELCISDKQMKELGKDYVKIVGDFLREENLELFRYWSEREDKKTY
jgi:tRNA(Arg) A34 adenosine deaminase TadA